MAGNESVNSESTSSSETMIEAIGLSKFYGAFAATRDVCFSVPRGEVCAFLGPNGAGKSTTMKMLTGFLAPSKGRAVIGGFDVATQRLQAAEVLGYLPENGPLYSEMSPRSFLTYVGKTRLLSPEVLSERLNYVCETCMLTEVWDKQIGKLSRGYRQRVGMAQALLHDPDVLILDEPTSGLDRMAQALLHDPDVLILDEPTSGLDPNQVHGVRELITTLGETKTVLLSTHILQEVHAVCDRVVLINDGAIVFDGATSELGSDSVTMENRFRELTADSGGTSVSS